jgi:DNA-binding beta-propeller fold protein YncE
MLGEAMRPLLALLVLVGMLLPARADKLVLVAGGGDGGDGSAAAQARLIQPFGVDFLGESLVFVEMAKGERLRQLDASGKVTTLAGMEGVKGNRGDGGPAAAATFNGLHSLAVGPDGCVYLADTFNYRVRKYNPKTGTITAFAGTGQKGFAGDGGPAITAQFGGVHCVAFDPDHTHLYLTDLDNRRIRKVNLKTGTVVTVAGNGEKGVPKDGEDATKQPLVDPRAHAVDRDGNLWILERGGHALRVVDAAGKIRTVAGTGKPGRGTGPALSAALNGPKHLCLDRDGTVLIADSENHRIVRYSPKTGTLSAVAGTGTKGAAGVGGDPLQAELAQPHGVHVHPTTGEIYIADSSNGRILKIIRD